MPNTSMNLSALGVGGLGVGAPSRTRRGRPSVAGPQVIEMTFSRHDVAFWSCLHWRNEGCTRRPPVPPGEPTGLNKERPGQSTEARSWAGSRSRETLPPGNHNPGDGQVVSKVNICESAIKIVISNEPKWLSGSGQKGQRGSERGFNVAASWMLNPPVDSRHLTSHMLWTRNVETPYISHRRFIVGEWACRKMHRSACGLEMSEKAKAVL